jgi:hypothetical protein
MAPEDDIVRRLLKNGWSEPQARLGYNAQFKCEYCDKDFLASVENYKEWTRDHIVPLWVGGSDDPSNIAAVCRTCNYCIKNKWDPRTMCGTAASRQQLIAACREYISDERTRILAEVLTYRQIVWPTELSKNQ